jgi:hypothetical protein
MITRISVWKCGNLNFKYNKTKKQDQNKVTDLNGNSNKWVRRNHAKAKQNNLIEI